MTDDLRWMRAAVALGESVQLPADALVDYAASTIAVLDVAKGALHVVPYGDLGEFSVAAAKPVLDKLGENAVVTVGRDGTNGIVLAETTVSRRHARFARGPEGTVMLTDEGSANGVFVNGQRVQQATLVPGDQIQIGDNFFRFEA